MPYVSTAQQRFFHTPTARAKGITQDQTDEYDAASAGLKLPKRAPKRGKRPSPLMVAILSKRNKREEVQ